jgi:hypothetical protein
MLTQRRFRLDFFVLAPTLFAWTLLALLAITVSAADAPAATPSQAGLRINEFMAANQSTLEDPHELGEFPDWIELYNPGPNAVSLDGLYLTDDPASPTKAAIGAGLTIPANGFLLFFADNDPSQGAQHLTFQLSRVSGIIGLYNGVTETVIDSYAYGEQTPDVSEGRQFDGTGNWRFFSPATPGATNTLLPPAISSVSQSPAQPVASAPVTVTAVITDERGVASVTLYYSMTGTSLLSTTMTLGANNTYNGQIPAQPDGTLVRYYLLARDIDDLTSRAPASSFGQTYRYVVGFQAPLLYINEIMAANATALQNPHDPGNFPDWIELYNPGPNTVSLNGLFLTDDVDNPTRYRIPNGLTIAPGGYLLFYADGNPGLGAQHTNFSLSRDGEFVGLYGAQGGVLIDSYEFGVQLTDFTIGRYPDGNANWLISPCITPAGANTACATQLFLPIMQKP